MPDILKKNPGCISFLLLLPLLPFSWYVSLIPAEDFSTYPVYTGFDVMRYDAFQYLAVYLLCLVIQYLIIDRPDRAFLAAFGDAVFCGLLMLFPLSRHGWVWMIDQYGFGSAFYNYVAPSLKPGFYLAVILLLTTMAINLTVWIKSMGK